MPKNIRGGKHSKKGKNSGPAGPGPMEYPAEEQYYGVVVRKLGNAQLDLIIAEPGSRTTCPARGVVRSRMRRIRFLDGMMVIVSLRPFEKLKPFERTEDGEPKRVMADVLYVYSSEHARRLINENRIPNEMKMVTESAEEKRKAMESVKSGTAVESGGDAGFVFADGDDDAGDGSEEVDIDDI